ncbi:hypothetical protein [Arenimonas sp.]|uniref:hypothetical protein n=1 Tax=Arenimonas sp. TaxID=1872635 RepID=UPI0039E511C0
MIVKRVGALSLGKLMGLMYGGIGLLVGAIFGLVSMVGGMAGLAAQEGAEGAAGAGFMAGLGLAAVVIFPIMYGLMGFIGGLLSAVFYNLAARFVGGVELDVE